MSKNLGSEIALLIKIFNKEKEKYPDISAPIIFGHQQLSNSNSFPTNEDISHRAPYQEYAEKLFDYSEKLYAVKESKKLNREHDEFQYITSRDIYEICIGILQYLFEKGSHNNDFIFIQFYSESGDFFKSENLIKDSFIGSYIPVIEEQIKLCITDYEKQCSKVKNTFIMSFSGEISHEKGKVLRIDDDRIVFRWGKDSFSCTGNYYGSCDKVMGAMRQDINLLFCVLEYMGIIAFDFNNAPHSTRVSLMARPHASDIITLTIDSNYYYKNYLLRDYSKELERYTLQYTEFSIYKKILGLFSRNFSNKRLRYILNYFREHSHIHTINEYLQYWNAIELMLGMPKEDIKNILKHTFYTFLPHEHDNYFDKLRDMRCKGVHEGQLGANYDHIHRIKGTAKELFEIQLKGVTLPIGSVKDREQLLFLSLPLHPFTKRYLLLIEICR